MKRLLLCVVIALAAGMPAGALPGSDYFERSCRTWRADAGPEITVDCAKIVSDVNLLAEGFTGVDCPLFDGGDCDRAFRQARAALVRALAPQVCGDHPPVATVRCDETRQDAAFAWHLVMGLIFAPADTFHDEVFCPGADPTGTVVTSCE